MGTEVRASEQPLTAEAWRQIVDSAVYTAIITTDEHGRITTWNEGARRILGWTADEMVGQTLHRLFPDDTGESAIAGEMEDALRSGRGGGQEGWRVRKGGELFWAAGEISPIRDGRGAVIGFTKVLRDRSEQRAADEAAQEERRLLEVLNRAGSALAAETELHKLVQIITDAGVELTGAEFGAFFYNVRDEDGESLTLYTLSGAPIDAFSKFPMPRNTAIFGPTFRGEGIVRSKDITKDPRYGHNKPYKGMPKGHLPVRSYLAIPVLLRSKEVIGGLFFGHQDVGVFTDESERGLSGLAAEAAVAIDNARLFGELRSLNEQLEQRVNAEVARRAEAEEALRQSQKMEAVGQLTGGIAHDFNNLLTVVTGNVGMAQRALDAANITDARTRRALTGAMKGAERAATLTQRLLAFSRRQPLAPKVVDVDKLVLGMSDLLQRSLGELIKLEIIIAPGLWRIEADPNQLESAILNLAVNARDAMPKGGDLVIETANARLDENYAASHAEVPPGQYVMIAVTDSGTGMSKEVVDRAFEPFFTTKEIGKGTGLGLSMIYGFIKQSGGHVKIYSEEGQGTTIKMYLPRLLREANGDEETGSVSSGFESSPRQETILVVEDDDDVRAYTVDCLRELGYRVLEAHDGPSALRLLERQEAPVDLLFTDVVMPAMTGRELADEARKLQPRLRVLYTSGYTRNAIVHAGRLDPGVDMIAKPFTFEALAEKVRDSLDAGRTRCALIVDPDPSMWTSGSSALAALDMRVEIAGSGTEALNKVRVAKGRYDVVILDDMLHDHDGASLANELRALHLHLPLVVTSRSRASELGEEFSKDPCTTVLERPYSPAELERALRYLDVNCGAPPP
ncbi:MAG TPA: response regulator [Sphingomicrobium sp.]